MKFEELDLKMRIYETAPDRCVVPNLYMVARLDGRNFTRLTKDTYQFEAPFDEKFRDLMIETLKHLMNCGFKVIYGYTESDEISLLFDLNENAFGRKHRKYTSILAGEASAKFSSLLGGMGVFDCRIAELPNAELVVDYFRWRNEDTHPNLFPPSPTSPINTIFNLATPSRINTCTQRRLKKTPTSFPNTSNRDGYIGVY